MEILRLFETFWRKRQEKQMKELNENVEQLIADLDEADLEDFIEHETGRFMDRDSVRAIES